MKREKLLNAIGKIDDRLISDADPQAQLGSKKHRRTWIAVLAACLTLMLCIGIAAPLALGSLEAGKVTMEINPGVEFTLAKNGKVMSVRFLNDDAKDVLGAAALKGESLKNAVSLTIAAYKLGGYMERNDTVLISFDKRLNENTKLRDSVAEDVRQVLEAETTVHTLVCVPESDNAAGADLAARYGISLGKAELVGDAAENSDLTVDDLVKLPLDELVALQKKVDTIIIDEKYIGMIKAKAIALADAGCTSRVEFTEAILIDNGSKYPHYHLVFTDGSTRWTYDINAINGDILFKIETPIFISQEKARAIALADAGIDWLSEKVIFTKEELSRNQGRPCWIIEFYTEKFIYSYKIDARTGEIIFFDYHIDILKAKKIALDDAGCSEKVVFTEEKLVSGGIKTPYFRFVFNDGITQWTYRINAISGAVLERSKESLFVPLQKAKEIALADANLPDAEEPVFTKEELSRNQGRPCWVLEFVTSKYFYVSRIDAKTGEIIFGRRYITMEKAKAAALTDAGCSGEARIVFTEETLVDGGIKTPYYHLVFNDGETQWTYRINAVSGAILAREKESLLVPLQKAKEIALDDADVPADEKVIFIKEELDHNYGQPCWILEFVTSKYFFVYKIDARTGEVLYNRRYFTMAKVKEIALADSGCLNDGRIVFTEETLVDGGIKTPYYRLVFNDGITQWTYRINAVSGAILASDKQPLEKLRPTP